MFSAFSGKDQEELEGIQTDFNKFRSTFDRGISVQTLFTTGNSESRLKELGRQMTELCTFMQAVFE